jgi:acyl-CoA-binding protein
VAIRRAARRRTVPRPARVDPTGGACYLRCAAGIRARRTNSPRSTAMADLKAQFEQAAKDIKELAERPDNDTLLKLYALYKQGAEGDVNGPKPGFFDFVGTAKYEAWAKLKGTPSDEAQKKYVDLVKKLRS